MDMCRRLSPQTNTRPFLSLSEGYVDMVYTGCIYPSGIVSPSFWTISFGGRDVTTQNRNPSGFTRH